MFIRLKKTSSGKTKVQLCEAIREDKKVRQVIIRHMGVAQDEKHLEELKRLALAIKAQIKEEREGPFLFALDQREKIENETCEKRKKEEMSIEETRSTLCRTQASLLKDHETIYYYKVPSKPTTIAKKIYQTFGLIRNPKIKQL